MKYAQAEQAVIELVEGFIFTYTVFKIAVFAFVNIVLYYVWNLNHKIQDSMTAVQNDLVKINQEVTEKSLKLREYQNEL